MAGEAFGHYSDLPTLSEDPWTTDGDWVSLRGGSKKGWYLRGEQIYWGRLGRSLRTTQVPWNKTRASLARDKQSSGYVQYTEESERVSAKHATARPNFVCCGLHMMLYTWVDYYATGRSEPVVTKSIVCRSCGRETQEDPVAAMILAMEAMDEE
jgi:hypothetical protein|tara:strand:+ start:2532 stop:2993 length:462 start_codon:yes stop_codon:yes gene_type:complete